MVWLGVWQLQRARWKEGYSRVTPMPRSFRRSPSRPLPIHTDQLPLFRYATGLCLRSAGSARSPVRIAEGEPGYVHIVQCATGAEGPGMSVEVGWSKDPNAKVNWPGGLVSGIIVPDRVSRIRLVAASAPPGLEPSKTPDVSTASAITPAGHRGYAATWFALAVVALAVYGVAVRKRLNEGPRREWASSMSWRTG